MKKLFYVITMLLLSISSFSFCQTKSDFDIKAFYIDCRHEVMTLSAIKQYAKELSQHGINTILMEYEATFPFEKNATLCNQYAFSKNEVKDFVSYCSSIGIEVIPLQNCFGHSEYILRHDRYSSIREDDKEVSQVCPVKIEEAKKIFTSIFKEVADLHPSKYFHIGCDETYLLGSCPDCKAKVKEFGESKLFVDYVNAMADIVIKMGKTPVIWADIILKHPEAINELRKEIVFVDWNYGWDINRFGKLDNLLKNNVTIWGATAMRSHPDQMYLTQWNKHLGNLTTFIPFTRQSGYKGIINTSWSTGGTYGFHYDTYNEIINMQPIRSVYPQSGFNFLVEAFCDAINSNKTFDEKDFALKYAHRRFGFDDKGCQIFYEYMMMPQEIIRRGGIDEKNVPVEKVYNDCVALRKKFAALVPKTNRTEFEHLLLMLDIRINYLGFKKIEKVYESPEYNESRRIELLSQLTPLIKEADSIDGRFVQLNKSYLKGDQVYRLNSERSEKMRWIYQVLKNHQ